MRRETRAEIQHNTLMGCKEERTPPSMPAHTTRHYIME